MNHGRLEAGRSAQEWTPPGSCHPRRTISGIRELPAGPPVAYSVLSPPQTLKPFLLLAAAIAGTLGVHGVRGWGRAEDRRGNPQRVWSLKSGVVEVKKEGSHSAKEHPARWGPSKAGSTQTQAQV